jgi:DNA-binding Lrp family transcriptional regulator
MPLDVKTWAIMRELMADPRLPISKIAARVRLSRATCTRRVEEVLREKVASRSVPV